MTAKDRIMTALAGGKPVEVPVGIDYMGLYLAEATERAYVAAYRDRLEREGRVPIDPDEDVGIRAQATLQAYGIFQNRHGFINIFGGPSREVLSKRELILDNGEVYQIDLATGARQQMLLTGEKAKTEEYRDIYDRRRNLLKDRANLKKLLDGRRENTWDARGDLRLVEAIVRAQGDDYFVYTGAAAPFWSLYNMLDFDGMMTALHDGPDEVFYLMDHSLEQTIAYAQAFKDAGGHAVRVEECLASADLISQDAYERFALPYEERLFSALRSMGLKTILYFCGHVMPRLSDLRNLPVDALMVEESKKDFVVEIGEVRAAIGPDMCLLGNLDSYADVLNGSDEELAAEVERQIRVAGACGAFIVSTGSPLTLDTPPERVDFIVESARSVTAGKSL